MTSTLTFCLFLIASPIIVYILVQAATYGFLIAYHRSQVLFMKKDKE